MVGEWETAAVKQLGIRLPIVGAPMGGGPSSPALVAAVSEAGGLGSLAGGYSSPDRLRSDIAAVRAATAKPFAVNLFVPTPAEPSTEEIETVLGVLAPYRAELELPPRPSAGGPWAEDFEAQVAVLVEERVAVASYTFGLLPPAAAAALHDAGSLLMGTATTVDEAVAAVAAGADLVCAQGSEAGAHRGTFLADEAAATISRLVKATGR
jgi:nitronate monooxygenase